MGSCRLDLSDRPQSTVPANSDSPLNGVEVGLPRILLVLDCYVYGCYMKRGLTATIAISFALILTTLVGCSSSDGSAETAQKMPDLVGQSLPRAETALDELGVSHQAEDVRATRGIYVKKNWIVVTQSIDPGAELIKGKTVTLGVEKATDAASDTAKNETPSTKEPITDQGPAPEPAPVSSEPSPPAAAPTPVPAPAPVPAPTKPSETAGQKNARRTAAAYIEFTGFSRSGLIKQLEFEKYSTADAEYAVDSIGADWNEQAARSAAAYIEFTGFSRDGLITQLEFEGYTPEQAAFGADSVGL